MLKHHYRNHMYCEFIAVTDTSHAGEHSLAILPWKGTHGTIKIWRVLK